MTLLLRTPPIARAGDHDLARLVAGGSDAAFAELVARYGPALRGYCQSIVRRPHDAEDALQSTFERAHRALRGGATPEHTKAWLYRIARNESISLLRRRREETPLPDQLPGAASSAHEEAERADAVREILADVVELPERQRTALVMRELQGLEYGDVAAALGTDADNARLLTFQARGSLKAAHDGRELPCAVVREAWQDGGGRSVRRRGIRAHLRTCDGCRAYVAAGRRRRGVAAWLPGLGGLFGGGLFGGAGAGVGGVGASLLGGGGMAAGMKAAALALAVSGTYEAVEHAAPHPSPAAAVAVATTPPKVTAAAPVAAPRAAVARRAVRAVRSPATSRSRASTQRSVAVDAPDAPNTDHTPQDGGAISVRPHVEHRPARAAAQPDRPAPRFTERRMAEPDAAPMAPSPAERFAEPTAAPRAPQPAAAEPLPQPGPQPGPQPAAAWTGPEGH